MTGEVDEVDGIVAGWARTRPDLDFSPLHLLSRIGRLARILDDRREQAFAEHGLALHEFDVLAALRRSDAQELTPGQLLEATHVTSGTMTNRLDRLEKRSFITRRQHPDDGRQSLVRLTAQGRKRVDGAIEALLEYETSLVELTTDRDRNVTIRALRTLLAAQVPNVDGPDS